MKCKIGIAALALTVFGVLAVVASGLTFNDVVSAQSNDQIAVLRASVKTYDKLHGITSSSPVPADFDTDAFPGRHNKRLAQIQQDIVNDLANIDPATEICGDDGKPEPNGRKRQRNVTFLFFENESVNWGWKNLFERKQSGCCATVDGLDPVDPIGYVTGEEHGESSMIVVAQMNCTDRTIVGRWHLARDYPQYGAGDFIDRLLDSTKGPPRGRELLKEVCRDAGH